jgi:hypothetical protein
MSNVAMEKFTYCHVRETLVTTRSTVTDETIAEKLATIEEAYRAWMAEVNHLVSECKQLGHDLKSLQYQLGAFEAKVAK